MSGTALTYSFGNRPFDISQGVFRRLIRLGLPMALSTMCAAVLLGPLPNAHVAASALTGPMNKFAQTMPTQFNLPDVIRKIAFEGMLTGFSEKSLLPAPLVNLLAVASEDGSYNSPLWTLHIEFYGSLLVLALVALRATVGRHTHLAICAILGACFIASALSLFIIGHLLAPWLTKLAHRRSTALGASLLALGILICTFKVYGPSKYLLMLLPSPPIGPRVGPMDVQSMVGAVLIFVGIALVPAIQIQLERPGCRWLGKISFSIYLVHFPILFTVVAAGFLLVIGHLSYGPTIAIVSVTGMAITVVAAMAFERWVDSPAVVLSRMVGRLRLVRP
jgi:peptidoglycan/LPS O-acetylase OafA/YrhL